MANAPKFDVDKILVSEKLIMGEILFDLKSNFARWWTNFKREKFIRVSLNPERIQTWTSILYICTFLFVYYNWNKKKHAFLFFFL